MKVSIRYLAQLRHAAGLAAEAVELAGPHSVEQLLAHLAARRPALRGALLTPEGHLQPTLLMFIGDEQVRGDHLLRDGDELTLLTPVAGGGPGPERAITDAELALYEWQLTVPGFGEEGQRRLKSATVLISRVGGVGGAAAQQLAAAGVGKLVLAHAGAVRPNDLNRQVLMTYDSVGAPRVEVAARRLRELNPFVAVEAVTENVSDANAERLAAAADLVVCCAPLFAERLALNRAAVRQGKPLVDCAMFDFDVQVLTVLPGRGPCLACLCPEEPPGWRRQFPVFGAVAGAAGCLGAVEAIKLLGGLGEPPVGKMLLINLREMTFRKVAVHRRAGCAACGELRG